MYLSLRPTIALGETREVRELEKTTLRNGPSLERDKRGNYVHQCHLVFPFAFLHLAI